MVFGMLVIRQDFKYRPHQIQEALVMKENNTMVIGANPLHGVGTAAYTILPSFRKSVWALADTMST